MTDDSNPASAGTAPLGVDDGMSEIFGLLSGQSEETTADERDDEDAETGSDEDGLTPDDIPDDEDGEGSEDEEPTPDTDEEPKVRLADGTEVTLAEVEEWRKGTLRQADYTRKTQELAEQRKQAETLAAEAQQRASEVDKTLQLAIMAAERHLPPAPDASMLDTDPIGYLQAEKAHEAAVGELRQLYAQQQQLVEQHQQQQMQQFEEMKAREAQALLTAMPHLKDPKRLKQFQTDLVEAMAFYGFQDSDLSSLYDHRTVRLAADAVAYRKLMAKKMETVRAAKGKPAPVLTTGKRPSPAEADRKGTRDAMQRLQSTGSIHDGAEVIARLLKGR